MRGVPGNHGLSYRLVAVGRGGRGWTVAGVGCTAVREATCSGEGGGATDAGGGAASRSAREDESEGVA